MKPSRRHLLLSITAMSCANRAGSSPIRLAICNNTFQGSSFAEACRLAARAGYTGLEIGPVTLSEDPAALPPAKRAELRRMMSGEGLTFVGLHNLLAAPKGLHITTPDESVRERSWEYFRRLIDLCADLGGGGMVLGSSKQRDAVDGVSRESATSRIRDGLAALAPHASERNVLLLPETLAPQLSNVLNTLDETVAMVRSINHPAVQTLFDTHNTAGETDPHDALIQRYAAHLRHVHLNEMDGRHPGTGGYDFALILRALRAIQYQGWASVEVFQFQPSGEEIARSSAAYVRKIEAAL
jgi:D-psicose/D-tagatose/L-ribulose 3-epimerase